MAKTRQKSHETFLREMLILHPDLIILGDYEHNKKPLLVENKYGVCLVRPNNLCMGKTPTIESAINKNDYFNNQFKAQQPVLSQDIQIVGNYVNNRTKILVSTKYGNCLVQPVKLLNGCTPTNLTAVNKNDFFINQAREIHKHKYDYSLVEYKNIKVKIKLICPEHGEFEIRPDTHLSGSGCSLCNSTDSGWYKNSDNWGKPCTLYFLEFKNNNELFYKVGVSVDVRKRMKQLDRETSNNYSISVLKLVHSTAYDCYYNREQPILESIKNQKLMYIPGLEFSGMYECFTDKKFIYE